MILVRDIILNKNQIWNRKPIQYTANKIKGIDDAIKLMQVPELEIEDIYLGRDLENKVELAPAISHQNNHKAEDFDADVDADKAEAKNNDLAWAESQYLTLNLLFFEVFLANSIGLSVENADIFESKGVDHIHEKSFVTIIAKKRPEYCPLKPAIMTQLEK